MDHLAEQFVSRRLDLGLVGPGRRIPEDLRRLAMHFARPKIEAGAQLTEFADRLGVLPRTLERWLAEHEPEPVPTLREVVVREEAPPLFDPDERSLVVATPDGFRIEGVTAIDLPHLLRHLP